MEFAIFRICLFLTIIMYIAKYQANRTDWVVCDVIVL